LQALVLTQKNKDSLQESMSCVLVIFLTFNPSCIIETGLDQRQAEFIVYTAGHDGVSGRANSVTNNVLRDNNKRNHTQE